MENNLYSRIKPEIMAKLNEESIKYPNTFKYTISDLKSTNNTLDLRYGTIVTFYTYDIIENPYLTTFLNIFNNE